MESIIARQHVARRRAPPSPLAPPPVAAPLVGPAARSPDRPSATALFRAPRNARESAVDYGLVEGGISPWFLEGRSTGLESPTARRPVPRPAPRRGAGARRRRGSKALGHALVSALARGFAAVRAGLALLPGAFAEGFGRLFGTLGGWIQRSPTLFRAAPSHSPASSPGVSPAPSPGAIPSETPAARTTLRAAPRGILLGAAGLVAAAGLATVLAVGFARPSFPLPSGDLLPVEDAVDEALLSYLFPELSEPAEDLVLPPPPRTLELKTYTVKPGDSLGAIARRFGLGMDSLVSLNRISSAKGLKTGAELKIPNMDGLIHLVARGESLGSLARRYKTDVTSLADANDLGSEVIRPGQSLFIPGARLPEAELRRVLGEFIVWPIRGPVSSGYGYRLSPITGLRQFHGAVDIVAPSGTPIRAAIEGRVADSGYSAVYGNYVIISHADGWQSLYGHLSSIGVRKGATLRQGETIGAVGNTGYSTGPHLHFGLYRGGTAVNPLKYLK